jgi:hypothetical protein
LTRNEIEATVRMLSLVESTNVSTSEINDLTDDALRTIAGLYPFPVTIIALSGGSSEPAFDESFHWIVVEWVLAQLYVREEYFDVAAAHKEMFQNGVRQMIKFYTGGRT